MAPKTPEKKPYACPTLKTHGSIQELTRGEGWHGDHDQWWLFSWGTDVS